MGWCFSAPKGNEVSSCAGGVAAWSGRNCVLRNLCDLSGIASELPVASQYLRMLVLEAQGGDV
jgi:hypothetical protein